MLYEDFDSTLNTIDENLFKQNITQDIINNLNQKFQLREYQKEAIGRFNYYFKRYPKRKIPIHLLFNMATGSGKTLIMAANILFLYNEGYRNFIFFVNSTNIIEKTKDNFLNLISSKYLFNEKIKFQDKLTFINEVENFSAVNNNDINIVFTTIQGLHTRLNNPKENTITYEDFENKEIVLISDEAHHINTLTKLKGKNNGKTLFEDLEELKIVNEYKGLNKTEQEEVTSWEGTVQKIFSANKKNILLEFTATIELSNPNIKEKYSDKIIYRYDLKSFRNDGYSKDIEVIQSDLEPMERALQAVILSQYRKKIAEKHKIFLKPVILFKSKTIESSKEHFSQFIELIKNLSEENIKKLNFNPSETIRKCFNYFERQKIALANLAEEIKIDFEENKCLSVNSKEESDKLQMTVNTLEDRNNEIRVIFAVDMLNEGWDVLNLFDIVRLFETRDSGNTTMSEAQLIGRGARYYPFQFKNYELYKRKFDFDSEDELRILEQLYFHSINNPKYISELKLALVQIGIYNDRKVEKQLSIKESFKESEFWKEGLIFINEKLPNGREDVLSFDQAKIEKDYEYEIRSGISKEEEIFNPELKLESVYVPTKREFKISDFGLNVIRWGINKNDFFAFANLKIYFPHISSINEFITSNDYLGDVKVIVKAPEKSFSNLTNEIKLNIVLSILEKIENSTKNNTSEFIGSKMFYPKEINKVFYDKIIKVDKDSDNASGLNELELKIKEWYAQNELYGTSEEKDFILFLNDAMEKLYEKYKEIALFRNERFFQIYNFSDGQAFEPDFVLFLREKSTNKTLIYQLFIEPKGDQFKDADGIFENSKEGWKQKFLIEIESNFKLDIKYESKNYKLIGLPFYNENLKQEFKKSFERFI